MITDSQKLIAALNKAVTNDKNIRYASKAFYGSRLSDNMTKTPEGYLICQNVPLSRTGMQEYLGQELGLEGDYFDRIIQVYRKEEDVFDKNALASFEGKPVTNEHPGDDVRTDNYSSYSKGHVQNIHRGLGEDNDKMIGDLIICDPVLISEIERGKREISCGYECVYMLGEDGHFYQTNIRGNHIAVVTAGRAGSDVSIKDTKIQIKNERSKNKMAVKDSKKRNDRNSILAKMLKAFAVDAEPEEIADAMEAMNSNNDEEPPTQVDTETKEVQKDVHSEVTEEDLFKSIVATLNQIKSDVAELKAGKASDEEDPLLSLEKELSSDIEAEPTNEENVTAPAEEIDEELSLDEDGPTMGTAELPENPIPGADKAALLKHVKSMKPIIAQIKDTKERKRVSDAFAKSIREQIGVKTTQPGGYGTILQTKQKIATKRIEDKKQVTVDDGQLGKDIAKKFNPHYKNKQ